MDHNALSVVVVTLLAQAAMEEGAGQEEALQLAKDTVASRAGWPASPEVNLEMLAEVREEVRRRLAASERAGPGDEQGPGKQGDEQAREHGDNRSGQGQSRRAPHG